MVTTLPSLKRSFSPHKHRPAFTSSIGNESTQSQTTDRIPSTGAPALFNLPGPDDYALGQEHPISHLPNRQTYNTDDASTLERFRIRELCEGWLLHRDACEWTDLRSIFDPSAFIAISWQQHLRDQAIDAWARGWERGDFTTHRVLGHAVEVRGRRAIDKMKVTISWRFADENGVEWDSDWLVSMS